MDPKNLPHWNHLGLVSYFLAKPNDDPLDSPMVLQYETHVGMRELLVRNIRPMADKMNKDRFEIKCLNHHFRPITIISSPEWEVEIKGDGVFFIHHF